MQLCLLKENSNLYAMYFSFLLRELYTLINKILPKTEKVIVQGFPNIEASAIEVANYIAKHYQLPVFYIISGGQEVHPRKLLDERINVIENKSIVYIRHYFTSRYIFFTHGSPLRSFSERQKVINIWHGLLYKKVGILAGDTGIPADITVGTSQLSKPMFSKAFGVSEESVVITGYPRNDVLLRAKREKEHLKNRIDRRFKSFEKVIIWLPTFRKSVVGNIRSDGKEVGNPFYIENFDLEGFQNLLKDKNTLCIIKPHPMAPRFDQIDTSSNLLYIDDQWLSEKGISLYQLVGCTDVLVSDVSSIITDYLMLDKPVVCVSTDFEEYKKTRGFYFQDIEEWIPSTILRDQFDFFEYLENILSTGIDPFDEKRKRLKKEFFEFHDSKSTKRLVEYVLGD